MAGTARIQVIGDGDDAERALRDVADEARNLGRQGSATDRAMRRISETFRRNATAADAAARGAGRLSGELGDARQAAAKLDGQIDTLGRSLSTMATEFATTGDRKILGAIRRQETELRKLTNVRRKINIDVDVDTDSAGDAARGFSLDFAGKIGPLLARTPIAGIGAFGGSIGAGVGIAMTTAIGAAITAGTLAATVGGVMIGGVKLAMRNPALAADVAGLGQSIASTLQRSARSFEPAIRGAMSYAEGEIARLGPELERAFSGSAKYIQPLTQGLTGFITNVMPGLNTAIEAAGPTIVSISDGLEDLGTAASTAFETLSTAAAEAGIVTRDIFLAAGIAIQGVATTVTVLAKAYGLLRLATAPNKLDILNDMVAAEAAARGLEGGFDGVGGAASSAASEVGVFADALRDVQGLMDAAAGEFVDAETALINTELGFKDLTGQIKANNTEIKDSRTRYLENKKALLGWGKDVQDTAKKVEEHTGSVEAGNKVLDDARPKFIAAANDAGIFGKEAEDLADKVLGIPDKRKIDVNVNKADAERDLSAVDKKTDAATRPRTAKVNVNKQQAERDLSTVDGKVDTATRPRTARVNVNKQQAEADLASINGTADHAARDRTATIRFNVAGAVSGSLGAIGQRMTGGPVEAGVPYIVGERRAELFVPSENGYILPQVPMNFDKATTTHIHINVNVPPAADQAEVGRRIVKAIREHEKAAGRQVLVLP